MLRWPVIVLAVAFVLIQFVPYGWWHDNPAVVADARWPNEESRRIARESRYSCHSNETDWPFYSSVAPASWVVRSDVEGGRDELNFSDWQEARDETGDAVDMISGGEMPPAKYTLIHRGTTLTAQESDVLVGALLPTGRDARAADGDERGGSDSGSGSGSSTGSGG